MALLYPESVEYLDVEQMQQTHEDEIRILNDIDKLAIYYEMDKTDKKLKALEKKIEEYSKHIREHFKSEEELMSEYGFPHFEMHKMAHDMFLADFDSTFRQYKEFGNIEKVISFIRKTPEWIVMHINTVDAPTASFLAKKMQK